MSNSVKLKVDNDLALALIKLMEFANIKPADGQISANEVLAAISALQARMGINPSAGAGGATETTELPTSLGGDGAMGLSDMAAMMRNSGEDGGRDDLSNENILLVGLLGIVTYQIKMGLTKKGANVTIVKGVDEAVYEFQKRPYTGVLIDINLPTEREGLMVLMEISRFAKEKGLNCNIGILAMPIKERRMDMENVCKQHGATGFIEKTEGWHQRAIDFFLGKLQQTVTDFPF